MADNIVIPPPEIIQKRIEDRRAEIAALKRMLQLARTAQLATELERRNEQPEEVAHAR